MVGAPTAQKFTDEKDVSDMLNLNSVMVGTKQPQALIAFYEQQVKDADDKANQSRDRMRRYITSNPRLAASDATSSGSSSSRPNLSLRTSSMRRKN